MSSVPLISVLINNYNYGRFLADAIDSVLAQQRDPFQPWEVEVVVVDDGSTDASLAVMERYGDRIVAVPKENGGQDSAFNRGFEHCRGEIICLLDADDRFAPNKLAKVFDCFARYRDIGWCFHSLILEDLRSQQIIGTTRAFPGALHNVSQYCDFRESLRFGHLPFYPASTSGLCFRRSLLAQLLPMPETFIDTSADRYLRVAAIGLMPGYFLADELTVQGIHDHNVSTLRPDRPAIPERQIVVAYMLRTQFPELTPYANRLFARGVHAYNALVRKLRRRELPLDNRAFSAATLSLAQRARALNRKEAERIVKGYPLVIRAYWQLCSPLEQVAIALFRLYRHRPWREERPLEAYYYHSDGPSLNSSNLTTAEAGLRVSK